MADYDRIRNQSNHHRHTCRYLLNVPSVWLCCAILVCETLTSGACTRHFYADEDNRDDIALPRHMAIHLPELSETRKVLYCVRAAFRMILLVSKQSP